MLSRERVIAVINHGKPDKVPVYGWVRANLSEPIAAQFGSVDAFEDHYGFDFAHLFGGPATYQAGELEKLAGALGRAIEPRDLLDIPFTDPDDQSAYADIVAQVEHHKGQRGRFVYVQTNGIFECLNGSFGIENHLTYLALYPEDLREVYRRQAEWNRAFALNCIELGVDMVHISDDWGAQSGLMFSPRTWWDLIYPAHEPTCRAVKEAGAFLSLHTDGNNNQVVEGIVKLGFDVVHPWQESAGMSLDDFRDNWMGQFTAMGGLDVQTTIGFGRLDKLETEIRRVLGMFRDGGLLYCTTHFIQDHCTMEELVFAFDLINEIRGA